MSEKPNLDTIRGDAPRKTPTVSALATFAAHTDCPTATLAFAAGVDLDRLPRGTEYEMPFGQSPYSFTRGEMFERLVKKDRYALLLKLLREELGFSVADAKVVDLRSSYPRNREGLRLRAHETRRLIAEITRGEPEAVNVIDGAVLTTTIGGTVAYFEADSLAARLEGRIHVGEIKSFPVVDGRGDPAKIGAALDQAAMYAHLTKETVVAIGADPDIVSPDALLITPKNVGLTPTLSIVGVERRIARAGKLLAAAPDVDELLARVGPGSGFAAAFDGAGDEPTRVAAIHELLDSVGTHYKPECLKDCGFAHVCRERAFAGADPVMLGSRVLRELPGVHSLERAAELGAGTPPSQTERAAAEQLARAGRVYDRALRAAGGAP